MTIAARCEKCRDIFFSEDKNPFIEFDYYEKKITFICRNKDCKHENVFDLSTWQKQQKHSTLPVPIIL